MAKDLTDEGISSRLTVLDDEIAAKRAELVAFAPEARRRARLDVYLDETEAERFTALDEELTTLEAEREPLAKRAETIARARKLIDETGASRSGGKGPEYMRTVNPFEVGEDYSSLRSLSLGDAQSRALKALEVTDADNVTDAGKAQVEALIRKDRTGVVARHVLATGSPAYTGAFEAMLAGRKSYQLRGEQARAFDMADEHMSRASMAEGTGSTGGFLVPFYLDPTLILTNDGSVNPFRQISRVEKITTNKWNGVSSAGVSAGYLGEAAEVPEGTVTFAQPVVNIYKAAAYLEASFEVVEDTNVAGDVARILSDAHDNFEATEFAVGTGSGSNHINGVVPTVVAAATGAYIVDTNDAATYAVEDVYNLAGALGSRFRKNASFVSSNEVQLLTRQFAVGPSQQQSGFWADLAADTPSLLLGKSIREASAMDTTVVTGKNLIAYGDFSNYLIVDRIGMTIAYEPLVKGADQRPTGEVGWFAYWRVGGNVLNPSAFRVLQVS